MGDGKDSGKVLDIKTADIKATAPVFHTQGQNLSKALTTLVTTLDGLGKPWGRRRAGQAVRRRLQPPQQTLIEKAAGTLVLGLVSIHEAMADMSDGHVDNDELISGMFKKAKPAAGHDQGDK
ncbi:hypothetical protein GTV15_05885 [Streptomyces sp. SID7803]|nr:hypothetical protein [Streptomyces sp. SID7803]